MTFSLATLRGTPLVACSLLSRPIPAARAVPPRRTWPVRNAARENIDAHMTHRQWPRDVARASVATRVNSTKDQAQVAGTWRTNIRPTTAVPNCFLHSAIPAAVMARRDEYLDPEARQAELLECMNKRNKLARKKKRKRMGERISLRYR